jgi:hypothetical protein
MNHQTPQDILATRPAIEAPSRPKTSPSLWIAFWTTLISGCGSIPQASYESFEFPSHSAYTKKIDRPFQSLGWVRSKVNFQSLDANREEASLCKNYYNKSVRELVETAKTKGADAVINIQSIVFLEDGRKEAYITPECSDDGFEGQILTQGLAVKWEKVRLKSESKNSSNSSYNSRLRSEAAQTPLDKKTQAQDDLANTPQSPDS